MSPPVNPVPSAAAAQPAALPVTNAGAESSALLDYRDDGPMARALGRTLGRSLTASPLVLTALGVAPLAGLLGAAGRSGRVAPLPLGGAVGWLVVLGGSARGRPHTGRLIWLVPPLLRATEYAGLLGLAAQADRRGGARAVPLSFALLAALSFHHYDTVYRLRHQRLAPPEWVGRVGGGWDGRLLGAAVLLPLGALPEGLLVAAVALGGVYATESTTGWLRFSSAARPALYADDEDEDE